MLVGENIVKKAVKILPMQSAGDLLRDVQDINDAFSQEIRQVSCLKRATCNSCLAVGYCGG